MFAFVRDQANLVIVQRAHRLKAGGDELPRSLPCVKRTGLRPINWLIGTTAVVVGCSGSGHKLQDTPGGVGSATAVPSTSASASASTPTSASAARSAPSTQQSVVAFASCALALGEPGELGVPIEKGGRPLPTPVIETIGDDERRAAALQFRKLLPGHVSVQLDAAGMNETTVLTGPWRDARTPLLTEDEIARVGRLLSEHPCLYGLLDPSAVRFFPRSSMSDLGSTSGHYGTMLLEKTAEHLRVSRHLWPIPPEPSIDLAPWKKRFPDTNEVPPNLPACTPAREGDCVAPSFVVSHASLKRAVSCDGRTLRFNDVIVVQPTGQRLPTLFDPAGPPLGDPQMLLEWNPPNGNSAFPGTLYATLPCLR